MITISPDCVAGKCAACSGDGWDEDADELAPCPHVCHTRLRGRPLAETILGPIGDRGVRDVIRSL